MINDKRIPDLFLLNVGYAAHNADWNWKSVSSPFARIYCVDSGSAKLHMNDNVYELLPGNLYFVPPFNVHGYECTGLYKLYYIHIYENPRLAVRIMEQLDFPVGTVAENNDKALIERLLDINPGRELKKYNPSSYDNQPTLMKYLSLNNSAPYHYYLETRGILFQLLSRFLKEAKLKLKIKDNRILKSLLYIHQNIDRNITTEDLAQMSFITKDHYIRLFKKEAGYTPIGYIHRKKIEKAQLMLVTENLIVKEVAYRLSFENISYFNRIFKKLTGTTPLKYRKNVVKG
jgi:AraC-like DNA-binding protein